MNFIAIFLIGIGLSMDAFAVSICQGLIQSGHNKKEGCIINGVDEKCFLNTIFFTKKVETMKFSC
ncbi:MntP/YtaF family protein [Fusobacterium necrophorum]|uniref:hypothetical protein n=1 Tax=Fusobacterium necrophorum TaxID=859 RepID=UPI00373AF4B2